MPTTYCTTEDIQLGDIEASEEQKLPYMQQAFDEIDAKLGWLYATPLNLNAAGVPNHERLLIKMISVKLATGRMFLSFASSMDSPMHSYGLRLVQEGLDELHLLANADVPLSFPRTDPTTGDGINTPLARTPGVVNSDSESLILAFTKTVMTPNGGKWYVVPDDGVPDTP
jgi:hypothetical protein